MAELAEYLMRYMGAPATAFQASDTVVGVSAVDRSPVGTAVAADAEGTGSDAITSSTSSTPAARRPTSPSGRATGIETFTFFQLLLTRQGPRVPRRRLLVERPRKGRNCYRTGTWLRRCEKLTRARQTR